MLDTMGHDDELAWPQIDLAITETHPQAAGDDQEEFVLDLVSGPLKGAAQLHELDLKPLMSPATFGLHASAKDAKASARFTFSFAALRSRTRPPGLTAAWPRS
jgi:hypothetical protein